LALESRKWVNSKKEWEKHEKFNSVNFTDYTPSTPNNEVDEDFIFETKKGSFRFGDVDARITAVLCPFHKETSPYGTFLNSIGKSTYHVCRKCGTTKIKQSIVVDDKPDTVIADFIANKNKKKPTPNPKPKPKKVTKQQMLDDMVGMGEKIVEPYTRAKRGELIKKHCLTPRKRMLLYAFEGFGKSYLTVLWARDHKKKVLFGCSSNVQAEEQAKSFKQEGCRVQLIVSREHRLANEYQVEIERNEPSNPWEQGKVKIGKTKTNMIEKGMTKAEADELWDQLKSVDPDFENYDIVVTTHARIQSYGRKMESYKEKLWHWRGREMEDKPECSVQIPDNAIVVFDDPSKADFERLKDFNNDYVNKKIDGKKIGRRTIGNYEYFFKPKCLTRGFGFKTQYLVFTTTELVTVHLIKENYEGVYEPKLMPDDKMDAGDIHLLKTEMVRKKKDGMLPPIVERIHKEGFEFEYIADGQGNKYNLTNSKGQNVFIGKDTLIEISQAHPNELRKTQHELGLGPDSLMAIKVAIALDQVHQAIGRNSGYRWSDQGKEQSSTCIVLCDPHLYKALLEHMRYATTSNVDADQLTTGFRKRERDSLLNSVKWFLQNSTTYICSGLGGNNREYQKDALDCLNTCPPFLRERRKKRVLLSLDELYKRLHESFKPRLQQIIDIVGEY